MPIHAAVYDTETNEVLGVYVVKDSQQHRVKEHLFDLGIGKVFPGRQLEIVKVSIEDECFPCVGFMFCPEVQTFYCPEPPEDGMIMDENKRWIWPEESNA